MSKRTKFLLGIGVIAALVLGWQIAAFAVHDTGEFQLEGNATTDPSPPAQFAGDDWDRVCKDVAVGPPAVSGLGCTSATGTDKANDTSFVAELNPQTTYYTGGGSKDIEDIPSWLWKNDTGGLPDKANLTHSFAATYDTSEGENLYFGADRFDNSGDAAIGFWFFQNEVGLDPTPPASGTASGDFGAGTPPAGTHAKDDLLVISNFSNGGTVSSIHAYKWDPACTGADRPPKGFNEPQVDQCGANNLKVAAISNAASCTPDPPGPLPDTACAIVNSANGTTAPWTFTDKGGNHTFLKGEFMEGGINLNALGLGDTCFSTALAETRTSTSPTSTLKDFTIGSFGECGSGVTTQQSVTGTPDPNSGYPSTSIGTGSVSVSDTVDVNVSGTNTWDGTVQFSLTGPIGSTIEETEDIGDPVAVDQDNFDDVSSINANVTAAGDYCWSAHFDSNTTGVPDGDDDGTNECFTVTPVTPTLNTQAVASPVVFGQPVQDNATLSGTATQPGTTNGAPDPINPTDDGAAAGGKITFTLNGPDSCTAVPQGTGTNPQDFTPISGDATYGPVSFTPNAPGTYHWKAQYFKATSDPNNTNSAEHNTSCDDLDEDVIVNQQNSTLDSTQRWVPNDEATLNHGGPSDYRVTFTLLKNVSQTDCLNNTYAAGNAAVIYGPDPRSLDANNKATSNNTTAVTSVTADDDGDEYRWKIQAPATGSFKAVTSCVETTVLDSLINGGTVTSP